jgi:hypothetical protein
MDNNSIVSVRLLRGNSEEQNIGRRAEERTQTVQQSNF